MFTVKQAASERAGACSRHRIILLGLAPDESEKICLLAEILGWQVRVETARVPEGALAGDVENGESHAERGGSGAPARLVLHQAGSVIAVEADDPDVCRQLARQGLDRLVQPVSLRALEQLLMFAG